MRRAAAGGDEASRRAVGCGSRHAREDGAHGLVPPARRADARGKRMARTISALLEGKSRPIGHLPGGRPMSTATVVKPSLIIRRRFKAAPERVYRAWTEPAQVARWFGPGNITVLEAVFEPRTGGRFMIHARSAEGEDHRVSGTVREAIPNSKVVYTWAWQSTPERQWLGPAEFKP